MKIRFNFMGSDDAKRAENYMYYALQRAHIGAVALTWVDDEDDASVNVRIDDPHWQKTVVEVLVNALNDHHFINYGYGEVGEVTRASGVTLDESESDAHPRTHGGLGIDIDESVVLDEREDMLQVRPAKSRWFTIDTLDFEKCKRLVGLCKDMHFEYECYDDGLDIKCTRNDVDFINRWIECALK